MRKIVWLLLCLNLSACAAHQQFDCPYKEGTRCLSVGEIDKKINAGGIGQDYWTEGRVLHPQKTRSWSMFKKLELEDLNTSTPSPLRTQETVLTLWIAPYYSMDGIYHEPHRLHFLAKEASWTGILGEVVEEMP